MKILEEYKRFVKELLIEADEQPLDDKEKEKAKSQGLVWKGKGYGKEGEPGVTHKNVDGKLVPVDKDGDDDGADDSQKLGGSDFDRDGGDDKPKADEPKGDDVDSGKRKADRETADMLSDTDLVDDEGKILGMDTIDFVKQVGDSIKAQNPDMSDEDYKGAIERQIVAIQDTIRDAKIAALKKATGKKVDSGDDKPKGDDKGGEESISDEDLKDTILQDLNPSRDSDRDERGLPNSKEDWENEVEEVDSAFQDSREYYERTKKEYEDESVTDDPEEREYLKDRAQKAEKEFIKRRAVRDAYKEKGETLGIFDHVEPKKPFLKEQLERIGGLK